MNAEPLLKKIARTFAEHHLEAVMVGNAAAALHGAPVTTLDVDFMFRKTPTNLKKAESDRQGFAGRHSQTVLSRVRLVPGRR
jgi:hypothetical protein